MEEIWRDIEGYEGLYQVSNLGRVKSLARNIYLQKWPMPLAEKILKPYPNKKGYLGIDLRKDNKRKCPRVHRLVAQAFISNPENKPQVNHKDCNKLNNKVNNLEWCNNSENQIHAWANNMQPRGTDRNMIRKKVRCIELDKIFNSLFEASKYFTVNGYSGGFISGACIGKYKQAYGYHWEYIND